jgi:hypothetical protein
VQRSALCRSRRELSNAYLLAKIGVDTAENEPLEVWGENSIHYSLHSLMAKRALQMANRHLLSPFFLIDARAPAIPQVRLRVEKAISP